MDRLENVIGTELRRLKRENEALREARDELMARNAELTKRLHRRDTALYETRRSRDKWKEKAKERNKRLEGMRFYLVESHPKSKAWMKAAA